MRNTHELERLRSGALAALGRMATQVAHELKNPLAGLRLYARHLEQRLTRNGDGEGAELAQKITSTVDHLAAVVQEITAFGRPPELHRVPTVLPALLDECVAFAEAKCETPGVRGRACLRCLLSPGDAGRPRAAQGHAQSRAQCDGVAGTRRQAHRQHRLLGRDANRHGDHRGHGERDDRGDAVAYVRSVLHDQAAGHRARAWRWPARSSTCTEGSWPFTARWARAHG